MTLTENEKRNRQAQIEAEKTKIRETRRGWALEVTQVSSGSRPDLAGRWCGQVWVAESAYYAGDRCVPGYFPTPEDALAAGRELIDGLPDKSQ